MLLNNDSTRLRHMLEAAREATNYAEDLERAAFESNRPFQLAIVRCIEVVGEAAARLSQDFRTQHAHIPWQRIIATRNRIVHTYFDLDLDILWHTATEELPWLCKEIDMLLSQPGERPGGDTV